MKPADLFDLLLTLVKTDEKLSAGNFMIRQNPSIILK